MDFARRAIRAEPTATGALKRLRITEWLVAASIAATVATSIGGCSAISDETNEKEPSASSSAPRPSTDNEGAKGETSAKSYPPAWSGLSILDDLQRDLDTLTHAAADREDLTAQSSAVALSYNAGVLAATPPPNAIAQEWKSQTSTLASTATSLVSVTGADDLTGAEELITTAQATVQCLRQLAIRTAP